MKNIKINQNIFLKNIENQLKTKGKNYNKYVILRFYINKSKIKSKQTLINKNIEKLK